MSTFLLLSFFCKTKQWLPRGVLTAIHDKPSTQRALLAPTASSFLVDCFDTSPRSNCVFSVQGSPDARFDLRGHSDRQHFDCYIKPFVFFFSKKNKKTQPPIRKASTRLASFGCHTISVRWETYPRPWHGCRDKEPPLFRRPVSHKYRRGDLLTTREDKCLKEKVFLPTICGRLLQFVLSSFHACLRRHGLSVASTHSEKNTSLDPAGEAWKVPFEPIDSDDKRVPFGELWTLVLSFSRWKGNTEPPYLKLPLRLTGEYNPTTPRLEAQRFGVCSSRWERYRSWSKRLFEDIPLHQTYSLVKEKFLHLSPVRLTQAAGLKQECWM